MIEDGYRISSNFRPPKGGVSCNVQEFFDEFHDFYTKVLQKKIPNLPHSMCDPYGFALLCKDYEPVMSNGIDHNGNPTCKEAFLNVYNTPFDSPFKFKFSFTQLLDLLYRGYFFNYDLAVNVYNMQNNPLHVFKQIIGGQGYIINKFRPTGKKTKKLINYAYDSQITLDESKIISVPYKHRVCDGKTWPCIISKSFNSASVIPAETDGYGEGLFVIDDDTKEIIDVLKINDFWLVDTPLENRLKFAVHCREYPVTKYAKVFSWRSALKAAKAIGCTKEVGVLVRSCHEDYFKNEWFEWSERSLLYCAKINGKLIISGRRRAKVDYYMVTGDLAELPPQEQRLYERVWLDDFDIKEFQMILEL